MSNQPVRTSTAKSDTERFLDKQEIQIQNLELKLLRSEATEGDLQIAILLLKSYHLMMRIDNEMG